MRLCNKLELPPERPVFVTGIAPRSSEPVGERLVEAGLQVWLPRASSRVFWGLLYFELRYKVVFLKVST